MSEVKNELFNNQIYDEELNQELDYLPPFIPRRLIFKYFIFIYYQ